MEYLLQARTVDKPVFEMKSLQVSEVVIAFREKAEPDLCTAPQQQLDPSAVFNQQRQFHTNGPRGPLQAADQPWDAVWKKCYLFSPSAWLSAVLK